MATQPLNEGFPKRKLQLLDWAKLLIIHAASHASPQPNHRKKLIFMGAHVPPPPA